MVGGTKREKERGSGERERKRGVFLNGQAEGGNENPIQVPHVNFRNATTMQVVAFLNASHSLASRKLE